jgi:GxxExxY protein
MHPNFLKAQVLSSEIIGAAIEVHRHKGPGLIESIYEKCLMRELQLRGITAVSQLVVPIEYKGFIFEEPLRLDVYAEGCVIVENKVVEKILPVHRAQLLSYMRLLNAPIGLIFNFHEATIKTGMARIILKGADQP